MVVNAALRAQPQAAAEDADDDLARITHWTIAIVQPSGYRHSSAMMEIAETLLHALRRLGRQADLDVGLSNREPGGLVVLGAHLLPRRCRRTR